AAGDGAATAAQLPLLPGEGGGGRLQERRPAPPLHFGEGQDPFPPDHRRLPPAPGAGRSGGQARPRDGASSVRDGAVSVGLAELTQERRCRLSRRRSGAVSVGLTELTQER